MSNPLYTELKELDYVHVVLIDEELPPDSVTLYFKNLSDQDTRITVTSILDEQLTLENQNPSLVVENNSASFCLNSLGEVVDIPDVPPPPDEGQIGEGEMTDEGWSLITFDSLGTVNPSYTVTNPTLGEVSVTTHACFVGQTISQTPELSAYTISNNPTLGVPLQLSTTSGFHAQIKEDGANPTSPVLAGNVGYDSPVSVLFSKDVHAVGLTGGYFDEINSTYIEVYDRLGNVLGSALNTKFGIETFGFSVGTEAKIAGFSFYVNSLESAGFALDNLKFK